MQSNKNAYWLLVKVPNSTATFKDNLQDFDKAYAQTIKSINHPPESLSNYAKNLVRHKNLCMSVYSSLSSLPRSGSIQDILQ